MALFAALELHLSSINFISISLEDNLFEKSFTFFVCSVSYPDIERGRPTIVNSTSLSIIIFCITSTE